MKVIVMVWNENPNVIAAWTEQLARLANELPRQVRVIELPENKVKDLLAKQQTMQAFQDELEELFHTRNQSNPIA